MLNQEFINAEESIKNIVSKKYPDAVFKKPHKYLEGEYAWDVVQAANGTMERKRIGTIATLKVIIELTAPESSHPELAKSITTVIVEISYNQKGERRYILDFPAGGVDVNYSKYDPKINNKNISLARKFNRHVCKWFQKTFTSKFPKQLSISPEALIQLNEKIDFNKEYTEVSNLKYIIYLALTNGLHGTKRYGNSINKMSEYGFHKIKSTYFFGETKVGSKASLSKWLTDNILLVDPSVQSKYPTFYKNYIGELNITVF